MIKILWLLCLTLAPLAGATTYNVTAGSNLQTVINGASAGDTIAFAAGTYNVPSGLTGKCGVTYTGPVVAANSIGGYTPTAILNGSSLSVGSHIINFYAASGPSNPCTQATTLQYLNFNAASGIFVQTPYTNLTVQYNQFTSIPGSSSTNTNGVDVDHYASTTNTAVELTSSTITHNQFGDANSCLSPTNVFADTTSPENYEGYCAGVIFYASIVGLTVTYNNFNHVAEGLHIFCPNFGGTYPCEPPNGAITQNISAQYNDFNNMHRMGWEEQPQQASGIVFLNNSEHDWVNPYFGSFGLSMACCYNGTLGNPVMTVTGNTVVFNTPAPPGEFMSYGMEAMGHFAHYDSNYLQETNVSSGKTNAPGIAYGCGNVASASNNILQGAWGGYIVTEGITNCGTDTTPGSLTGNVTGTAISTRTSAAPSISPTSGVQTFPLTVTLTDAGYTSGAGPQGNTGIWYTTDNSNPVPGQGTAKRVDSGGAFTMSSPGAVKAVGMWGAANQPTSYPNGYGWIPSAAQSANYTSGGASPTLTGVSLTLQGGGSSVQVGNSVQACAVTTYASGPTQTTCGAGSDSYGNTIGSWGSSDTTKASISSLGSVSAQAMGVTNLSVHAGSFTAPSFALTVTAAAPVLQSVAPTCAAASIAVSQTTTCTLQCTYTGPSVSQCPSAAWTSDNTGVATVGASSGVVTGVAAGTANITGSYGGLSNPVAETVTSNAPPAATLNGVSVSCNPASVQVGNTVQCAATCSYSDGTSNDCTTTDPHGSLAGSWNSASPTIASVGSSGLVTGLATGSSVIGASAGGFTAPGFTESVTAAPTLGILGNNQFNVSGSDYGNYNQLVYAVATATSTVASCTFSLGTGTQAAGKHWDCGIILATSPTAEATSWLCHNTYTTTGTVADQGFHILPLTGCGTITNGTGLFVATNTDQTGPVGQGYWSCAAGTTPSCNGAAPSSGNGTYPCRYVSAPYGTYTGMATATTANCGNGKYQAAQYLTLTTPPPTLVGGYLTVPGSLAALAVGQSVQIYAAACYSDGTCYLAFPTADQYGTVLTSITSSAPSVASVGAIGGMNPALVTGQGVGAATINGVLTGGKNTFSYVFAVSTIPLPLPPVSPRGLR